MGCADARVVGAVAGSAVQLCSDSECRQPASAVGRPLAGRRRPLGTKPGSRARPPHETVGVTALDGEPDVILKMPGESYMPFLMTLCLSALFAGLLIHLWWLAAAGMGLGVATGIAWLWPLSEAGEGADE